MAKDKKTIRFWLRNDRANQDGTCPVHLVYQIKGIKKVYGIPQMNLLEKNWDVKNQMAVYVPLSKAKKLYPEYAIESFLSDSRVNDINRSLLNLITRIQNIEKRFELDEIQLTPELVINALKDQTKDTTKKQSPGIYITDYITRYCSQSTSTHKYRTLQVYEGVATHLRDYEKKTGSRVTFENLDLPFLRGFVSYLTEPKILTLKNGKERKVEGMNNITIAKQISTLKTLLKVARVHDNINVNLAYQDYKTTRKDSSFEVVTLTNEEFILLFEMDLTDNKRLDQVRDVFCFSCATGLRYSDLAQLKREHIRHNVIRMTAEKTGQRLDIPLNPYSFSILEKYKELHHPLPIISGQKTNEYLKELGELAGINTPVEKVREYGIKKESVIYKKYELMSIHMGRKTFTTLSLEKGMAPQEVMALTGHTTYKAFKRYVDVTNERKKIVMAQSWGEVKESNLKIV